MLLLLALTEISPKKKRSEIMQQLLIKLIKRLERDIILLYKSTCPLAFKRRSEVTMSMEKVRSPSFPDSVVIS